MYKQRLMLYYLHTQTHNKYKDRTQTVLLTKPPSQRTNTCLTNRNMIIFCPKHNHKPFPPPEDTTRTDEVWIGSRSSRISTIVANIDGTAVAQIDAVVDIAGTDYYIAHTITVPADASIVLINKEAPVYLTENSKIELKANATGDLHAVVSYDEIS